MTSTMPEMLLQRMAKNADRTAFLRPSGSGWDRVTWKETGERVRAIASGLLELGLSSERRCAILSSTRLEWILIDLGILCAGGATTTVYPSSTADESAYILADSKTMFAFAENDAQVQKLAGRR